MLNTLIDHSANHADLCGHGLPHGLRACHLSISAGRCPIFLFVAGNFVPFQILMLPVVTCPDRWTYAIRFPGWLCSMRLSRPGSARLFMRNFMKALPFELIESARIEGVGEFRIFWHLVLPLVTPAIAALCGVDLHVHLERFFLGNGDASGR